MQILDRISTLKLLCKNANSWGMFISWSATQQMVDQGTEFEELGKAAPYLDFAEHTQMMIESSGYLLFDSEEDMMLHYDQTVGDDGPGRTKANDYDGLLRVYAVTCNPKGQLGHENT